MKKWLGIAKPPLKLLSPDTEERLNYFNGFRFENRRLGISNKRINNEEFRTELNIRETSVSEIYILQEYLFLSNAKVLAESKAVGNSLKNITISFYSSKKFNASDSIEGVQHLAQALSKKYLKNLEYIYLQDLELSLKDTCCLLKSFSGIKVLQSFILDVDFKRRKYHQIIKYLSKCSHLIENIFLRKEIDDISFLANGGMKIKNLKRVLLKWKCVDLTELAEHVEVDVMLTRNWDRTVTKQLLTQNIFSEKLLIHGLSSTNFRMSIDHIVDRPSFETLNGEMKYLETYASAPATRLRLRSFKKRKYLYVSLNKKLNSLRRYLDEKEYSVTLRVRKVYVGTAELIDENLTLKELGVTSNQLISGGKRRL